MLWTHCNKKLRHANVGSPNYDNSNYVNKNNATWRWSQEKIINDIKRGIYHPTDFIVIEKISVSPVQLMQLEDGSLLVINDDDGHDSVYGGNDNDDDDEDDKDDEFDINAIDVLQA